MAVAIPTLKDRAKKHCIMWVAEAMAARVEGDDQWVERWWAHHIFMLVPYALMCKSFCSMSSVASHNAAGDQIVLLVLPHHPRSRYDSSPTKPERHTGDGPRTMAAGH